MKRYKLIIGIIIVFLSYLIFTFYDGLSPVKAKEASVKANIRLIFRALSDYYSVKSEYPASIDSLANDGVIDFIEYKSALLNPFKGYEEKMINISPGDSDFEGNYTYIPITNNGKVTGCILYGYGSKRTPGFDIDNDGKGDHVIITLRS